MCTHKEWAHLEIQQKSEDRSEIMILRISGIIYKWATKEIRGDGRHCLFKVLTLSSEKTKSILIEIVDL